VKAIAAIGVLATACSAWHAQTLPGPVSPRGTPPNHFRAGVAQIDITPPPGVGLAGSGPEGRRSKGYRTRLSVRAMVLEDTDGERIALVVADLTHISPNLHRLAADRSVARTGIGADRLILSATHTHSGPGHFYAERQYNANSSRVPGYDPRLTEFLVERIAEAVTVAADSLHPAVINWDTTSIPGVTWNRSFEAFCLNPEAKEFPGCPPATGTPGHKWRAPPDSATLRRAVDPVMLMLRVDRVEPARAPLGSFAVFAMHPTAIPTLNTLIDGDTHVRITDSLTDYVRARNPRAVHLLANGAEGDAAPDVSHRGCGTPELGVFDPVPSPRGPGEAIDFLEPTAEEVTGCLDSALGRTEDVVRRIMPRMIALYERLGSGSQPSPSIRRGFTTVWLPGRDGLCGWPEAGSSTAAGAEDMRTRVNGWSWLFPPFRALGIEENGSAVRRREGECQSPKRVLLGALQAPVLIGEHGFPEVAQISVVRIDSLWLAALPAELTMTAGRRVLVSLRGAVRAQGDSVTHAALVGLANGFLQYVATREEYQWQSY
jgi:neutral ceramidase